MIDAGLMLGPRAYSTGPGVFVNSEINSEADARNVLTRYRDYYRTRNIKSYMVGGRKERQFMIQGASALGMMPTTEGASDLRLNLTHALDGFAGNEHALPVSPLHRDVIELFAKSRIAYTPTISVLYGGKPALYEMTISHVPQGMRRFSASFRVGCSMSKRALEVDASSGSNLLDVRGGCFSCSACWWVGWHGESRRDAGHRVSLGARGVCVRRRRSRMKCCGRRRLGRVR